MFPCRGDQLCIKPRWSAFLIGLSGRCCGLPPPPPPPVVRRNRWQLPFPNESERERVKRDGGFINSPFDRGPEPSPPAVLAAYKESGVVFLRVPGRWGSAADMKPLPLSQWKKWLALCMSTPPGGATVGFVLPATCLSYPTLDYVLDKLDTTSVWIYQPCFI